MSRKILTDAIQKLGYTNAQAGVIVGSLLETMTREIHHSKEFRILGFGTFYQTKTKKRVARNPQTGEAVDVPAGTTVRFRASKSLKSIVAKPAGKKTRAKTA